MRKMISILWMIFIVLYKNKKLPISILDFKEDYNDKEGIDLKMIDKMNI